LQFLSRKEEHRDDTGAVAVAAVESEAPAPELRALLPAAAAVVAVAAAAVVVVVVAARSSVLYFDTLVQNFSASSWEQARLKYCK
jgi:hypothetical protein